jgi:hypothetical protein
VSVLPISKNLGDTTVPDKAVDVPRPNGVNAILYL